MSASAIKDGLVTQLSAASALGSGTVVSHYRVLESGAACGVVVDVIGLEGEGYTLGRQSRKERLWTFRLEAFLKDSGDPTALMDRKFSLFDAINGALEDDDTLQGTADTIVRVRAERTPGESVDIGGATWLPITFDVEVLEAPD